MEVKCHEQIKEYERSALRELERALDSENNIHLTMQTTDDSKRQEDMFIKILNKPVMFRARDKMNANNTNQQQEQEGEKKVDLLAPIMKKLDLDPESKELPEESAIAVKNEALRTLKERLLTRAEII